MSSNASNILSAAAAEEAAWSDETRVAFDKRYLEKIEYAVAAYEAALTELQQGVDGINQAIRGLDY